jgi:predicted ATP-dependent serine protease
MLRKSSVDTINKLLGGYYERLPTAIFGDPQSGKSLFLLQEAHYMGVEYGGTPIFIDTEGGADTMYEKWKPKFDNRFGKGSVLIKDLRRLPDLLNYLGYKVKITYSEGGQVSLTVRDVMEKPPLLKDIQQLNSPVVIMDSLSKPLKAYFGGDRRNFPARSYAINYITTTITDIAIEHNIPIIITHHSSRDPANPYKKPGLYGGTSLRYEFKIVLYIQRRSHPSLEKVRDIFLVRFFDVEDWKAKESMVLTDRGFEYIDQDGIRKLMKGKKNGGEDVE